MAVTRWLAAGILLLLAVTAHAHAHLTDSDPRDGSSGKAPERTVLTLSETARLSALTLMRKPEPLPTTMAARITIPPPTLAPGTYILRRRVVGEDRHMTSGALHFSVESTAGGKNAARRRGA